jgi:hypothetical protein
MQKLVFPNPLSTDREFVFPPAQPEFEGSAEDVFFIHEPGEAPAVERDVQSRMRDTVHLLDYIDVAEHAAILDGTSTFDCSDAFDDILAQFANPEGQGAFGNAGREIRLPPGRVCISRPIQLKVSCRIVGEGAGYGTDRGHPTVIQVAEDQHGIIVHRFDTYDEDLSVTTAWVTGSTYAQDIRRYVQGGHIYIVVTAGGGAVSVEPSHASGDVTGADGYTWRWQATARGGDSSELRNFSLQSDGGTVGHGIWMRARATCYDIHISGFPENGYNVVASATAGLADQHLRGNANNFRIYNGRITGCQHGVFLDGADANQGTLLGVDCSQNLGWGFYDDSFLGNVFIGCHTNTNAISGARQYDRYSWVAVGEDASTTAPGTDDEQWWLNGTIGGAFVGGGDATDWVTGTTYDVGDFVQGAGTGTGIYECTIAGGGSSTVEPDHAVGTVAEVDGYSWKMCIIDWITGTTYVAGAVGTGSLVEASNGGVYRCTTAGGGASTDEPDHDPGAEAYPDGYTWTLQNTDTIWFSGDTTITEGGAFKLSNDNQVSLLFGCYCEGGQPSTISQSSAVLWGAGFARSELTENSAGVVFNQQGINFLTVSTRDDAEDETWTLTFGDPIGTDFLWAFEHPTYALLSVRETLNRTTGSLDLQYANSSTTRLNVKTLVSTTHAFGRSAAVPHAMFIDRLFVGSSVSAGRQVTSASAVPSTGNWAAGDVVFNSEPLLGEPWGWRCVLTGTPGTWQPLRDHGSMQTVSTGLAFTLTPGTSAHRTLYTAPIAADRAVTLSTTGALIGLSYRITRTAASTGAFNLNVGSGPLKALTPGTWCEVVYDGSAYALSAYGAL